MNASSVGNESSCDKFASCESPLSSDGSARMSDHDSRVFLFTLYLLIMRTMTMDMVFAILTKKANNKKKKMMMVMPLIRQ